MQRFCGIDGLVLPDTIDTHYLIPEGNRIIDILKFLKAIPEWNELIKLPAKVQELEKRVKALESGETASYDKCPNCKKPIFQLISSNPHPIMGDMGVLERKYKCSDCGFEETKTHNS